MALRLFSHPFASYCQKALIALYENNTPFEYRLLNDAAVFAELEVLWPHKKFPVLVDGDTVVIEASIIIEYLMLQHAGPARLIPADPQASLEVRFLDRFFDNYVMTPMSKIVTDCLRAADGHDPFGVADAKAQLLTSYQWLEARMRNRRWAAGEFFSMADCAAAPALFYADWVLEIEPRFANLRAYRARLLARPSVVRAVDEARPYRAAFPPGAPDRD